MNQIKSCLAINLIRNHNPNPDRIKDHRSDLYRENWFFQLRVFKKMYKEEGYVVNLNAPTLS